MVRKYEEKIKFDKVSVYQNGGTPQTGPPKCNFLTTHARLMKFSGYANMKKRSNLTKFGGTKMKESSSKKDAKTQNLTTFAGLMKFSE